MELETCSVEIVGSGFRDYVHLARLAPEFGGVDTRLHFEFLERVDRGQKDIGVEVDVRVVDAVQRVVVEFAALPRNRQLLIGARAALAIARLTGARELRADVRAQRAELQIVSAIERQLDDASVLDDGAD